MLGASLGGPGHADPGRDQGKYRTQVFKLGESKVLPITIVSLHVVLYSLESIVPEWGSASREGTL